MLLSANTIAIVANGSITDHQMISTLIREYDKVIAVDGGLQHCDRMHILPNFIIGDMDSVSPELLKRYSHVPTEVHSCEKDETDLELALKKINHLETRKITLFGAMGGRVDHTLFNLHLIRRYPRKVFIETGNELIFAFEREADIECEIGQTVSFIPMGGPVTGISSQGLKWELEKAAFNKDYMSISNICLKSKIRIKIEQGDLLCCLQKFS